MSVAETYDRAEENRLRDVAERISDENTRLLAQITILEHEKDAIRQRALADALAAVEKAERDMPDFSGHMFGEYYRYGNNDAAVVIRRLMQQEYVDAELSQSLANTIYERGFNVGFRRGIRQVKAMIRDRAAYLKGESVDYIIEYILEPMLTKTSLE